MNLDEWRKLQKTGEEAQLPSGLIVHVKRVGMMDLVAQGKIPATLKPKLEQLIGARGHMKISVNDLAEFSELIDVVCRSCIVSPVELEVSELPSLDRMAVFNWANDQAGRLTMFRQQPDQPLGT